MASSSSRWVEVSSSWLGMRAFSHLGSRSAHLRPRRRTTKLYDRRGQKVLLEDMERNAELGISLQMSSPVKCGVSRMNVLWDWVCE
jgi:hypothetical protein